MIRVLRCADYPAHARVVREPLCPVYVEDRAAHPHDLAGEP